MRGSGKEKGGLGEREDETQTLEEQGVERSSSSSSSSISRRNRRGSLLNLNKIFLPPQWLLFPSSSMAFISFLISGL